MQRALLLTALVLAPALAGCADDGDDEADAFADLNGDGVVVVALIDFSINPYHWDFDAGRLPQNADDDPGNDIPLDQDPQTWLPGFPDVASTFANYARLDLTLSPHNGSALAQDLHEADKAVWEGFQASSATEINYAWVPGTKIVGLIDFYGGAFAPDSHGMGVASVSVGNLHGTCPECLMVFVHGPSSEAVEWVASQPWIDAQSNSWLASAVGVPCVPPALPVPPPEGVPPVPTQCPRTDVPATTDGDLEARRLGVERGQSIFFAAGNGLRNDFQVPQATYMSSHTGNDWSVNVGAISPEGYSYTGHFKPTHVASLGSDYPRGAGPTVASEGKFSGTSNASPVVAGIYANALLQLRRELASPSLQEAGVIARGAPACHEANPQCALADGELTVFELREALFRSANYTLQGDQFGSVVQLPPGAQRAELTYMSEGHGTFWGRYKGTEHWQDEVGRVAGYADGRWWSPQNGAQADWFRVDSMCRQSTWGAWDHGYFQAGVTTLPAASQDWPVRTSLLESCPVAGPAYQPAYEVVGPVLGAVPA